MEDVVEDETGSVSSGVGSGWVNDGSSDAGVGSDGTVAAASAGLSACGG
eukprot:CAMPEP_0172457462 /NCGR_PEP_ID=MMETSP1065-20121228/22482_1 /TAXON_ID=265537 /ORGANISM="Amphiprora paludosa, Strain CCMP125" /LENGTH=48 /DNA_ID= /DNA_START= /DNA_END= /DNA_ORIENTATION=